MAPSGKWYRGRGRSNSRGHQNRNNGGARGHGGQSQDGPELTQDQIAFKTWCRNIPFTRRGEQKFHDIMTARSRASFMQDARRLIELHDDEIRQEVITKLASEGGLTRIVELLGTNYSTLQPQGQDDLFEGTILPFFQTVTHTDVLSSLLLEQAVGTIFVCLYGTAGRRATSLFSFCESVLKRFLTNKPPDTIRSAASAILSALLQVLECNHSASLISHFQEVVDVLQSCFEVEFETFQGTLAEQAAAKDMQSVRRHLKYGDSVPQFEVSAIAKKKAAFAFQIMQEGPGALCKTGQRHDNDHAEISEIEILPTAQEICYPLSEYLPIKDSTTWHLPGIPGLIDQQFRLLREDTVGQLRDCIHRNMQLAPAAETSSHKSGSARRQDNSLRVFTYSRVQLSDPHFENRKKQITVVASFDSPRESRKGGAKSREAWWENTKRLQIDSLVSIVDSEGNTLFFTVAERGSIIVEKTTKPGPSTKDSRQMSENAEVSRFAKISSDPQTATVTLRIVDLGNPTLAAVVGRDWKSKWSRQTLVEFPGILLPSFEPTLRALQRMSQAHDMPFSNLLLPGSDEGDRRLTWPAYATQPAFSFNLGSITKDGVDLHLAQNRAFDYAALKTRTTLDDAQCNALVAALSRNLALVQGPPGTGKSYVAVQAVKVLLECRLRAELNPIICVCYTNHALDQFLEQMLDDGVEKVIRIGGQSKSSRLEPINLRQVSQTIGPTKAEKHALWEQSTNIEARGNEITSLLRRMKRSTQPHSLKKYLEDHLEHQQYRQIYGPDDDGFHLVTKEGADLLQTWLASSLETVGTESIVGERGIDQLVNANLTRMTKKERKKLYDHWLVSLQRNLISQIYSATQHFIVTEERLAKCRQEIKLRCLEKAQIIGITTSGLAQNIELLRRLRPKVLICEEAGEILEAHTLTAFLPSIEHAILIGDHEQLRPQVQNYSLSLESQQGKKFALDMSTFERLITTLDVQHETLQTQRRMHPAISDLIRQTIYPNLKDHHSVTDYPLVSGFRSRLYWLDHKMPEAAADPSKILQSSHSNDHEVTLTESLVLHLVRQGIYGAEDIVVLTPYVRQLQKLRQQLAASFEIIVGEKDQDELAKQDVDVLPSGQPATHRAMLTQQLRISTVDNFQGEEAKVIVISLVRSNSEQKCGFLRTSNRINVLLSRAKHGMYIIGNSQTCEHVPMWKKVIELLRANGNIGFSIPLCCPKHPDTVIEAATPDDFLTYAPEGGCDLQCNLRLECGHACTFKCHSDQRHNIVICQEPCPRIRKQCGHGCPKNCGVSCGNCLVMVPNITLPCDHVVAELECHKTKDLDSVKCTHAVKRLVPKCQHEVTVPCHVDVSDPKFACRATCGADLHCGHTCRRSCHTCRGDSDEAKPNHGICKTICGRQYSTCGHACKAKCHGEKPCPLCDEQCPIKCRHSKCSKMCHEPCAPCAEPCDVGCQHQGKCTMPCAVPCNILPCSRRCDKILECGHHCPSICGEPCPEVKFCQLCAPEDVKSAIVGYIMNETFENANLDDDPIIVPPCGHLICRSSMDGIMDMGNFYDISPEGHPIGIKPDPGPLSQEKVKVCPQCRGSLREINRFARVVKRAMLDESTKRFIVWANAQFVPLTDRLRNEEQRLSSSEVRLNGNLPEDAAQKLPDPVCIEGERNEQIDVLRKLPGINQRLRDTFRLRGAIYHLLQKVSEREQPFSRVQQLSRQLKENAIEEGFSFDSSVLQTRHRLLTESLLIRADLTILSDFLKIVQESSHRKNAFPWLGQPISLDLRLCRLNCITLADDSAQEQQPMTTVESLIHFAKFVALERMIPKDETKIPALLDEAKDQLRQARDIIANYPSTSALSDEVDGAEKMLRDATFYTVVTSAERQAVFMAMARDFRGTGHWYYCENMHPFTIGECGMPMQTSRCPQCGAAVGGQSHTMVGGVTRAADLEDEFAGMRL